MQNEMEEEEVSWKSHHERIRIYLVHELVLVLLLLYWALSAFKGKRVPI